MPRSDTIPPERSVKGSLLVDYVKMIRNNPQLPWADHLTPDDLKLAGEMILPASWYPLGFFERIGMAIFKLLAKENYQVIRLFGRAQADRYHKENPGGISPGRPRDTLRKYREIHNRWYSFRPVETEDLSPQHLRIHTFSLPEEKAAKLILEISSGAMERLIELSGGTNIQIRLTQAAWEGAPHNTFEVTWDMVG